MIPAEFDYVAPDTLDEVLQALRSDEDAKVLAGGHSLLPLMKLRLAAPSVLVDIRKVPGLRGVQRDNGQWRIGALTRPNLLVHPAGTRTRPGSGRRGGRGGRASPRAPASR